MPSAKNEKYDKHLKKAFAFISKLNTYRKLERPYEWPDLWKVRKVLRWTFALKTLSEEEFSKKFKAELNTQMQAEFDDLNAEQQKLVALASNHRQEAEEAIKVMERQDKAAIARSAAEKSLREAHLLEEEHRLKAEDEAAQALADKEAERRTNAINRKKEIKANLESQERYLPEAGDQIKQFEAEMYKDLGETQN